MIDGDRYVVLIRAASTHSARPSPIQPTPPMSVTTLETDAYWTSNYSSAVSTRPINSTAASSTINAMRDVCAASVSVERLRHPISAWCLYSDISYSSLVARPSVILSAVAAVMEARTPERQSLTQHRVSATATGEGY